MDKLPASVTETKYDTGSVKWRGLCSFSFSLREYSKVLPFLTWIAVLIGTRSDGLITFANGFTTTASTSLTTTTTTTSFHRQRIAKLRTRIEMDPTFSRYAKSTETTTTALFSSSSRWESFDYMQHWYPMSWVCDLPVNKPTQLSLLDVNYAVAVIQNATTGELSVTALEDRCPHKSAALSEGRVTQSGYLQCAYHGWSFDQKGTCVQIPQSTAPKYSSRACAKAVPAMIHQGLVWLWPGPVPAGGVVALPKPPTVPEMEDPAFKVTRVVRDFPCVDWSLLVSNILDPDHGVFAHQTAAFDWYSADVDKPLQVEESFDDNNGAGWTLKTRVATQEKVLNRDRRNRGQALKELPANITSTTVFYAPTTVTMSRREDATNQTKFVTAFWVCPTGTGRSRFLSASVGKFPFSPPRWITHIALNRFLDQDTVLVASQQPAVLSAELRTITEKRTNPKPGPAMVGARSGLFVYQSPTDRSVRLIDSFWDATLAKVPRRFESLLTLKSLGLLNHIPPREVILDRATQHLNICPDSQAVVRNCQRLQIAANVLALGWVAAAFVLKKEKLRTVSFWLTPILSLVVGWAAQQIRKQFYYHHTPKDRDRDLEKIPKKMWLDPV